MLTPNSFLQDLHGPNSLFSDLNPVTNGFEFDDNSSSPSSGTSSSGDSSDVNRFSNPILRYISDVLMDEEDDLERKPCMLQECLKLQAAEKSFYDVLGHEYPSSKDENNIDCTYPDGSFAPSVSFESNSSCTTDNSYESDWGNIVGDFESSLQIGRAHV